MLNTCAVSWAACPDSAETLGSPNDAGLFTSALVASLRAYPCPLPALPLTISVDAAPAEATHADVLRQVQCVLPGLAVVAVP